MIEQIILGNLLVDREFARKVVPYLQTDYFEDVGQQIICRLATDFIKKYNNLPKPEALLSTLEQKNLNQSLYESAKVCVDTLVLEEQDHQWLIDEAEKFCHKRAIHNAVLKVVEKLDAEDEHGIDELLKDALAVSFDNRIGHDFFRDAEERWDHFEAGESLIPFDIEILNKITKGGLARQTLAALLAPTGVGKSLAMCHLAASYVSQGYNVIYFTLEMSEYKISRRIEANLYDMHMNEFDEASRDTLRNKLKRIENKAHGDLIVKQFPTGAAHAGHFRHTINEMKLKKRVHPDVIIVDYLGICASSRKKGNVGMYELYKSVAEELRALMIEFDAVGITGLQVNREGIKGGEPDMTDVAESMAIIHALDYLFGVINADIEGQMLFTQLKNRDGDTNYYKNFLIGVERSKMRFFDIDSNEVDAGKLPATEDDKKSRIMNVFE